MYAHSKKQDYLPHYPEFPNRCGGTLNELCEAISNVFDRKA